MVGTALYAISFFSKMGDIHGTLTFGINVCTKGKHRFKIFEQKDAASIAVAKTELCKSRFKSNPLIEADI